MTKRLDAVWVLQEMIPDQNEKGKIVNYGNKIDVKIVCTIDIICAKKYIIEKTPEIYVWLLTAVISGWQEYAVLFSHFFLNTYSHFLQGMDATSR